MKRRPNRHGRCVLSLRPLIPLPDQFGIGTMSQRKFCFFKILLRGLLVIGAALLATGCGGNSSGSASTSLDAGQNQVPRISGTPLTLVNVGTSYSFQPAASDADGDALSFQVSRLPSWATFNSASGAITGTPNSAHVGTTTGIVIRVSDGKASTSLASFSIQVQPPSAASSPASPPSASNQPPTISGTPLTTIASGQGYSFQPSASDANGDNLTFSITNQPAWITFNATTGRLTGTPMPADVGTYSNIIIRVSDGTASASLNAFSIAVTQISTGSATISWLPPTENTDGTPLTDLAGFRIYYGTSLASLSQTAEIANPGLTTHMIQNLYAATWYFRVRAYAADGAESAPSNIATKTIQ